MTCDKCKAKGDLLGGSIYLFLGIALVHLIWAFGVLRSPKELETTGLKDVYAIASFQPFWTPRVGTAILLIFCSLSSALSVLLHKRSNTWGLILILPQQAVMVASAYTAMVCTARGTFADGAKYNPNFILVDQSNLIVWAAIHFAFIVHIYVFPGWPEWLKRKLSGKLFGHSPPAPFGD